MCNGNFNFFKVLFHDDILTFYRKNNCQGIASETVNEPHRYVV